MVAMHKKRQGSKVVSRPECQHDKKKEGGQFTHIANKEQLANRPRREKCTQKGAKQHGKLPSISITILITTDMHTDKHIQTAIGTN